MSRKRQIKRLMALGIQRNDAAGFVKASRILIDKGRADMLPGVLIDPGPVARRTDYKLHKFATTVRYSDKYAFRRVPADLADEYVHKEIAREIGLALLDAGAIKITVRELPPEEWGRGVEYRGTITVAKEENT